MKKNKFIAITSAFFIIFLVLSLVINASALPMFTIHLLGIFHSDGADRTSWQATAQSYLYNIPNSYFLYFTAFDDDTLLSYLRTPDMFVIHTHGAQTGLMAVDAAGNESVLTVGEISALATGALSDLDLAFIGACSCGAGGSLCKQYY